MTADLHQPTPLIGTVTTSTASVVSVTIDGASVAVEAVVPQTLAPLLYGSTAVGARVLGYRLGKRFYVSDVISGGAQTSFQANQSGGSWILSPVVTFATWNTGNGFLNVVLAISGYSSVASQAVTVLLYMDGSATGFTTGFFMNNANEHHTLPALTARIAVTAGAHVMATSVLLNNDANDKLNAIGWVTPT